MNDDAKGRVVKSTENEYVSHKEGDVEADFHLAEWWDSSPEDARGELLDETRLVDIITDDLHGLADAFELLVQLRFHELPEDFQGYLTERVTAVQWQKWRKEAYEKGRL